MSRRESISRYNIIIKKLRKAPATFNEIADSLRFESELQEYNFDVSKRTFQRDLTEIRSIYNIDIRYNFSSRIYYIEFDQQPEVNERILEAFDTFNALNINERVSPYIHFEKRKPRGTENLFGLLHSIKNKLIVGFTYHKYYNDEISQRLTEPYALKEFKGRWYLVAADKKDSAIKTFALDRITEMEITDKKFTPRTGFDVNKYFQHSFGIMSPDSEQPTEVILSFDALQGKYIRSLPLHNSQEILKDDENELIVRLNIFITHDFFMEILSYGDSVKVICPETLIEDIKDAYRNALNQY